MRNKKKNINQEKTKGGISLIVLVITIIVMIILAATVIISLANSDIIVRANEAVIKNNLNTVQELANIGYLDAIQSGIKSQNELLEYIYDYLENSNIDINKYYVTITQNGIIVSLEASTYAISTNLTNIVGNIANKVTIQTREEVELIYSAEAGYRLPDTITVHGATYTWDKTTGKLILSNAYQDVTVGITGVEMSAYSIATSLTNVLANESNVTGIRENTSVYLSYTAASGYKLPDNVEVTGATASWDKTTGTLSISNPTSTVNITIIGEEAPLVLALGDVIPEGCEFKRSGTTYVAGQNMPSSLYQGDEFYDSEYVYKYNYCINDNGNWSANSNQNGWCPRVRDKEKTSYGRMYVSIGGKEINTLRGTFIGCSLLTNVPEIPSSVTSLARTFKNCTSLQQVPTIPESIVDMTQTFMGCTSLTVSPTIPSNVTDMTRTFNGCTALTVVSTIPSKVTNMTGTFEDCTALTVAPAIPSSVTNMYYTFRGCTSLVEAPILPSGVSDISLLFYNCKSLKTYTGSIDVDGDFSKYELPTVATSLYFTFTNCYLMTASPVIPDNFTSMQSTFIGCKALTVVSNISDNVTYMKGTFNGCKALVNPPRMPAGVINMCSAFEECNSLKTTPDLSQLTNLEDTSNAFRLCYNLESASAIPSTVTNMSLMFASCWELTGDIEINANPTSYSGCFSSTKKAINITGTGDKNETIANSYGNVTYVAPEE